MGKIYEPTLDPEIRLRVLVDNADKTEDGTYMKDLNQDELDAKRETLSANYIQLNDLDEELSEIKAGYKARMKPLSMENKMLLQQVKTRKEQVRGRLFTVFNHEEGMAEIYDESCEMIESRRLTPEEKQTRLSFQKGGMASAAGQ
ncbi:MAG TPA: hypothetical protein VL727_29140 [Puia sp.]|jgi:hypothetical protein|nr:hypothetical protein [Puia sp.]